MAGRNKQPVDVLTARGKSHLTKAEKERRKEERRRARENPDYGLDDLEPMPAKQKIVIGVILAMFVLLVIYLVMFNMGK